MRGPTSRPAAIGYVIAPPEVTGFGAVVGRTGVITFVARGRVAGARTRTKVKIGIAGRADGRDDHRVWNVLLARQAAKEILGQLAAGENPNAEARPSTSTAPPLVNSAIWPLAQLDAVCALAREHGMKTHMDGARLLNAVVASGIDAARYAAPFDSVWIDFSKGLGAPIGAALAGSKAFIDEAWRVKQRFGGAMRQAGIVAAAASYALEHHVTRLAEDHAHARRLAQGLSRIAGIRIEPATVETNLVYFGLAPAVRMDYGGSG